ncbi:MAG: hypothetical protein OXM01_08855 [Gemmatimonadota bacterium]|nr:hypothetical protein [Gemmatimonadota bacterium]
MKIRTPSIDQILQALEAHHSPPAARCAVDERRTLLQSLDQARAPLSRQYPAWIHVFTADAADAGIDPRLAAVPFALRSHRQGRAVISDPRVGMLFGSLFCAPRSARFLGLAPAQCNFSASTSHYAGGHSNDGLIGSIIPVERSPSIGS